jgi:hypothetical protein
MLHASLAASTWSKYESGWACFAKFEEYAEESFTWPLSKQVIRCFIVYCYEQRNLKATSIRTYLSSIVSLHHLKGFTDYAVDDKMVTGALRGWENIAMADPDPDPSTRRAMTMPVLRIIGHQLAISQWSRETKQTVWSACLIGFFASVRMGEILAPAANSCDPSCTFTWSCVQLRPDNSFLLHLRLPKMSTKEGDFLDIFPFPETRCCPVAALKRQHKIQREIGLGRPQDPVFAFKENNFLHPKELNKILKKLLSEKFDFSKDSYSCHSFRAGIPSALDRHPDLASTEDIKGWGRWSSDAFRRYTRLKVDQKKKIFGKITTVLQN